MRKRYLNDGSHAHVMNYRFWVCHMTLDCFKVNADDLLMTHSFLLYFIVSFILGHLPYTRLRVCVCVQAQLLCHDPKH